MRARKVTTFDIETDEGTKVAYRSTKLGRLNAAELLAKYIPVVSQLKDLLPSLQA